MSSPSQQTAKKPKRELHGPRPAPLKISKDAHKIRKPPVPANPHRPPTIIYLHSPEVIHTETREFMTLVQRLTGRVNTGHDDSSTSSSSSSFTIQSPICHALPHNPHTSIPGNPNICQVADASPNPLHGGLDFPVKQDNDTEFSGNLIRSEYSAPVQSLISPSIQYGLMSPFSPNFFQLPSPSLLSPNIFKEFPLCTPSQPDYLYSPYGNLVRMQSEPIFSPPPVRPSMNAVWSLPSPPPTYCDLFNNQQPKK